MFSVLVGKSVKQKFELEKIVIDDRTLLISGAQIRWFAFKKMIYLLVCISSVSLIASVFSVSVQAREWVYQSDENPELCNAVYERVKSLANPNDENSECSYAAALSDDHFASPEWQRGDISAYKNLVYELFIYADLGPSEYHGQISKTGLKLLANTGKYARPLNSANDFLAMGGEIYFLRYQLIRHMDASTTIEAPNPQILAQLRYPQSYGSANLASCKKLDDVKIQATLSFFINGEMTGPEPAARFVADKITGSAIKLSAGRAIFIENTAGDLDLMAEKNVTLGTICSITNH